MSVDELPLIQALEAFLGSSNNSTLKVCFTLVSCEFDPSRKYFVYHVNSGNEFAINTLERGVLSRHAGRRSGNRVCGVHNSCSM